MCDLPTRRRSLTKVSHRQPVMADEVQTFKALITIHKVLQEGHPVSVKEAQQNVNWIESLARGVSGEGLRGTLLEICYGGQRFSQTRYGCFHKFAIAGPVLIRQKATDLLFGSMSSFCSPNLHFIVNIQSSMGSSNTKSTSV
jgi:hypothetical protein